MEINHSEATGSAENTSNASREKGPWWPLGQRHDDWLALFQMTELLFLFSHKVGTRGCCKNKKWWSFLFLFLQYDKHRPKYQKMRAGKPTEINL